MRQRRVNEEIITNINQDKKKKNSEEEESRHLSLRKQLFCGLLVRQQIREQAGLGDGFQNPSGSTGSRISQMLCRSVLIMFRAAEPVSRQDAFDSSSELADNKIYTVKQYGRRLRSELRRRTMT